MKKKLLLLCTFCSSILLAQLPTSIIEPIDENTSYENYIGSIWKNRKFKNSKTSNPELGDHTAELRYNVFTDDIEYLELNTKALFRIKPDINNRIQIEHEEYYYCFFKTQRGQNRKGYYVLVELNDAYRVYKRYTLSITNYEAGNNSFTGFALSTSKNEGTIKLIVTYYIEEDGKVMEIPVNKKELLALIDDDTAHLKEFIKKEKLKTKKEDDLLRVVAKYNAKQKSGGNISKSLLTNRR